MSETDQTNVIYKTQTQVTVFLTVGKYASNRFVSWVRLTLGYTDVPRSQHSLLLHVFLCVFLPNQDCDPGGTQVLNRLIDVAPLLGSDALRYIGIYIAAASIYIHVLVHHFLTDGPPQANYCSRINNRYKCNGSHLLYIRIRTRYRSTTILIFVFFAIFAVRSVGYFIGVCLHFSIILSTPFFSGELSCDARYHTMVN